jgi:predicted metal-dependent phosphoesterase TrpH
VDDPARPAPGGHRFADRASAGRAFIDLHCHTGASFDSLSKPSDVMRAAVRRGLTHLAITDHDRIDAALRARDEAPEGLTIVVGQEAKTAEGDLICLFLERPIPSGLPAREAIAAVREQGGLVGIPHPFDRLRSSMLRDAELATIATEVDWVEAYNARVLSGSGNERAAVFAHDHGLPGVAASDAHTVLEVGVAYNAVSGDPSTPEGLKAALASVEIITGRASYFVRGVTPIATLIQRWRGNGRSVPGRGS